MAADAQFVATAPKRRLGERLGALWRRSTVPDRLLMVPVDSWPGDPARGRALLDGSVLLSGLAVPLDRLQQPDRADDLERCARLHGFAWLRDLRDLGGDAARRHARRLVEAWIADPPSRGSVAWRGDVVGRRLAIWLGLYEFFCASADDAFRAAFLASVATQARRLERSSRRLPEGGRRLAALKGLLATIASLDGESGRLTAILDRIVVELPHVLLPDGCHRGRDPMIQLEVVRDLVDMRSVLRTLGHDAPDALTQAISTAAAVLRLLRHGDHRLALFNGAEEGEAWLIDSALAQSEARGRMARRAPHGGFERLAARRTLVIVDAGTPQPSDGCCPHAGTLSFEMSVGRERLVVNCGALPGPEGWRAAQRATAAHSTLVVADTNSAELLSDGRLGRRPTAVCTVREDGDEEIAMTASHDGYAARFGLVHRRRLALDPAGTVLAGEDALTGPEPRPATLRFHLHPRVEATLTQDGRSVLLRLPSGMGWRFHADDACPALEESLYLGGGERQRTRQIVVAMGQDTQRVRWSFRREDRRS